MNIVLGGLVGASVGAISVGYLAGVAYYGDPDALKFGASAGSLVGYFAGTLVALGLSALR